MFAATLLAFVQLPLVVAKSDVDDLIAHLPPVGDEFAFDSATSSWTARPGVERMQALVAAGELSDAQWERALLRTQVVHWRRSWPKDVAYTIGLESPDWMGLGRITLTPRVAGWRAASVGATAYGWCGNSPEYDRETPLQQVLGPLAPERTKVVFDVVVERGVGWDAPRDLQRSADSSSGPRADRRSEGAKLWRGLVTLPVQLVETVDEVLPPYRSANVDDVLRRAIALELARVARAEETAATLTLGVQEPAAGDLEGTALSVVVEFVCDGEVRGGTNLALEAARPSTTGGTVQRWQQRAVKQAFVSFLPSTLITDRAQCVHWSVRVREWPEGALRCWNSRRRWAGDVSIPIAEALARGGLPR